MKQQLPLVSICVPIYNGEKYLASFLESALAQTLQEIEIICVDNHSTDSSKEIIEAFSEKFPNKILYFQTDHHYPSAGAGRNVAVAHARGEYIFFCDSDDLITPAAMEKLYECANANDSDLVCAWAYWVIQNEDGEITYCKPQSYKKNMHATNEMAIQSGCEFWMRLIKKDLLTSLCKIPEEYVFDDVAFLPVVHSYAKKIMFLDFPVYYYFRRESSASGSPRLDVCKTSILAEKFALENCNPEYRKTVEAMIAGRTRGNLDIRWPFFHIFADWAREQMEWIPDNHSILYNKPLFDKLKWAAETLNSTAIPNRIIINGFAKTIPETRVQELSEKVFCGNCDIVILNEQSCDISVNPYVQEAYLQGNYDFVAGYFALKEIYENGGIFIHDCITVLNYFFYYMNQNAFFVLLDKNTYSDMLFGAPAGCDVYKDLLQTYSTQWDKKKIFSPLSERINTILTVKYAIPLDGKGRLFQQEISIVPPDLAVVDTRFGSQTKRVICEHNFTSQAGNPEYITIKRSTLELLLSSKGYVKHSGGDSSAEKELAELKKSNVYKFVLFWKKLGDGPMGPFLKKVFHALMNIRAKLLRHR